VIYSCEKLIKDHLFRDEISKKAKEKSKEYTRKNVVLKYHDMIKFVLSDDKRDLELKENPVWSVVMPAYNVEKYILTAVNSVIDQTYDKWELIIVNDGSTDKTYDKIKDLIDNNRIRYIECSDGPHCQAYAWKKGIESARGQYIGFLDSDDWMSSVALKTMNDYYRDHSDVICAWSQNEQWSANMGHKLRTGYSEEPYKYGGLIDGTLKDFPGVMVSHFITCKKEFIPDIDESVLTSADRWLVLQMDLKGKLGFVNNILYRYRYLRSGSITKEKRNLQIKTLENIINNNLFIRNYDKSISLKIEDNCFDYKITQEKTV
jgi:glycosyltransferase involved in cell wall biosynthesis